METSIRVLIVHQLITGNLFVFFLWQTICSFQLLHLSCLDIPYPIFKGDKGMVVIEVFSMVSFAIFGQVAWWSIASVAMEHDPIYNWMVYHSWTMLMSMAKCEIFPDDKSWIIMNHWMNHHESWQWESMKLELRWGFSPWLLHGFSDINQQLQQLLGEAPESARRRGTRSTSTAASPTAPPCLGCLGHGEISMESPHGESGRFPWVFAWSHMASSMASWANRLWESIRRVKRYKKEWWFRYVSIYFSMCCSIAMCQSVRG